MANVKLILGDLFDQATDVLVVPCSTDPTISRPVYDNLSRYSLPFPTRQMSLGEVLFADADSIEHVASAVAFAASVHQMTSNAKAISDICQTLACFCNDNKWVDAISAPLLGTGAGGLKRATALETMATAFLDNCSTGASLNVYTIEAFPELEEIDISELVAAESRPKEGEDVRIPQFESPRVFISYGRSTDAHNDWVCELATKLRDNGVSARLDQFDLRRGEDLAQWMNRELSLADKVLLICDETYFEKFESRSGGAAWEATMILGDLYRHQKSHRHVAIQVGTEMVSCVPDFMRSRYNFVAKNRVIAKQEFDELLEFIFDLEPVAPPIGRPPQQLLTRLQNKTR